DQTGAGADIEQSTGVAVWGGGVENCGDFLGDARPVLPIEPNGAGEQAHDCLRAARSDTCRLAAARSAATSTLESTTRSSLGTRRPPEIQIAVALTEVAPPMSPSQSSPMGTI